MRRVVLTNCGALREVHAPAGGAAGGGGGGGGPGAGARRRRQQAAAGALGLSGCTSLVPGARERLAALVAA
jgi:hypothetical protein